MYIQYLLTARTKLYSMPLLHNGNRATRKYLFLIKQIRSLPNSIYISWRHQLLYLNKLVKITDEILIIILPVAFHSQTHSVLVTHKHLPTTQVTKGEGAINTDKNINICIAQVNSQLFQTRYRALLPFHLVHSCSTNHLCQVRNSKLLYKLFRFITFYIQTCSLFQYNLIKSDSSL